MFDLEKFKTGGYYVHLPTYELYIKVIEWLDDEGFRWSFGKKLYEYNAWDDFNEATCISYRYDGSLFVGHVNFYDTVYDKLEINVEKLHSHEEVKEQLGLGNNEKHYTKLMLENKSIYLDKNEKYGDAFAETIQKYGYISALTRMNDKFNRIEEFTLKGFEDEEESLRDSLMDLANYCYMYVMEIEKENEK